MNGIATTIAAAAGLFVGTNIDDIAGPGSALAAGRPSRVVRGVGGAQFADCAGGPL